MSILISVTAGWVVLGMTGAAVDSTRKTPKPSKQQPAPVSVGAIRWDGWFAGNPWEKNLGPQEWHDRLPFYAKKRSDGTVEVRSDSSEVMDREIVFARNAGIDYWAFCYYHPKSWPGADEYNYGWRLYLRSARKRRIGFCLLLQGQHLGPKEEWPKTAAGFVSFFREPTYRKVAGGRPLVYLFGCEAIEPHFGSARAARDAFDRLARECRNAGLASPYLVAQVFDAGTGRRTVESLGFDAVGAYSLPGSGEFREHRFADLADANREGWRQFAAEGMKVVPTVNAGWDGRPRNADPSMTGMYQGPWYRMPTPRELAGHLRDAVERARVNDAVEARTVLIYAWNESDEGGWLVPTLSEGPARLDAIRAILRPAKPRPSVSPSRRNP